MRRLSVCFASLTALLLADGTAAQAQLREAPLHLSEKPRAEVGDTLVRPTLGRMSIIDDQTTVTGRVTFGRDRAQPFSAYVGTFKPSLPGTQSPQRIEISDDQFDVGLFAGVAARVGGSGLRWDLGLKYQAIYSGPQVTLSPSEAEDALGVYGALRYDFGVAAVTASLSYAPQNAAIGKSAYVPVLAAEVPIGSSFTVSAGFSPGRAIGGAEAGGALESPEWGIAGTLNLLGFDVSLSYAEIDAAAPDAPPESRTLFRIQGAF